MNCHFIVSYHHRQPPPILRPRDLLRLMTLLTLGCFILWAAWKAGNARTWDWLFAFEPAEFEESRVTDSAPELPADPSITPDESILQGAWDRRPFLLDDPAELKERKNWRDANARYHLIELAAHADIEALAAHSRKGVRYSALLKNAENYRGQIIHLEGDVRRLAHFELGREIDGPDHIYQAWLTAGRNDQVYCLLFAELPDGLPPESEWGRMMIPVRFNGYFLKILRADGPNGPENLPVLVGRNLEFSQPTEAGLPFIIVILGSVFLAGAAVCMITVWRYRKGDRQLAKELERMRGQGSTWVEMDDS